MEQAAKVRLAPSVPERLDDLRVVRRCDCGCDSVDFIEHASLSGYRAQSPMEPGRLLREVMSGSSSGAPTTPSLVSRSMTWALATPTSSFQSTAPFVLGEPSRARCGFCLTTGLTTDGSPKSL